MTRNLLSHLSRFKSDRRAVWIGYVLVAVGLAVLPFVVDNAIGRTWVRIIDFALIYVMLALGLNIVVGFAGLLDLGYIAFYAVGAYTWALLASPQFDLHLPFWLILPICAGVAAEDHALAMLSGSRESLQDGLRALNQRWHVDGLRNRRLAAVHPHSHSRHGVDQLARSVHIEIHGVFDA